VGVEAIVFFLRLDLQSMAVAVEFETSFFVEAVLGSGDVRVNLGLEGGGMGGNDAVGIERSFDFGLHLATARKETLLEELLGVEVDGVFRNFAADDAVDVGAEVGVKGGDPCGEGWV